MRDWLEPWARDLERDIKRILEKSFGWKTRFPQVTGKFTPAVDVYEKGNEVIIEAEIPGVEKEELSISISENKVTIKGEVKREKEIKEEDYYLYERSYGRFQRTVELPTEIDADKAKANYKDGILKVTLPKKKPEKKLETEIKIE